MALPPHILKKKIDAMPEGEEKEKRLKSFNRQMHIIAVVYPLMLIMAFLMTGIMIVIALTGKN